MDDKDCRNCKYYAGSEEYVLGKCNYPVPAWIYHSSFVNGYEDNSFVNGYEATGCLTYKRKEG